MEGAPHGMPWHGQRSAAPALIGEGQCLKLPNTTNPSGRCGMKWAPLCVTPVLLLAMAVLAERTDPACAFAEPATDPGSSAGVQTVTIGAPLEKSNVPPLLAQGGVLPAQSVSAVDIS